MIVLISVLQAAKWDPLIRYFPANNICKMPLYRKLFLTVRLALCLALQSILKIFRDPLTEHHPGLLNDLTPENTRSIFRYHANKLVRNYLKAIFPVVSML